MDLLHRLTSIVAAAFVISLLSVSLSGCADSKYAMQEGDLAQRFVPSERHIDYPPDSLVGLTLHEEEEQMKLKLSVPYEDLHLRWSSSHRNSSGRRSELRSLTYATFWSLELSLASLEPELGVSLLTKDKAREFISTRREEYETSIQIDVFWFGAPSESAVAGPGTFIRLRDAQGTTYAPTHRDYGPPREAFARAGQTALYRRNTFVFPRHVDGEDILANTDEMYLLVSPNGAATTFRFTWSWDASSAPVADRERTRSLR